ncbi:MAG: orotidine-5'-phosphate decarboxylase [Rickettsiales bacterium]|jgi:orotidine-5'-phosphate decarboxylase|nr:orotidine-5'-phosphate decarboxylase [Rickettsiales bacterium]
MTINSQIKEKIVLAVDINEIETAKLLIKELKDYVGTFKFGLQFYTANGNELFRFMKENNINYFLDIKLMDIPNTVARASENITRLGANFFNVHALGGKEMMSEAKLAASRVAKEMKRDEPTVLAVTLLTSIDKKVLEEQFSIKNSSDDFVLRLAELAKDSGLDGVVASAFEVKRIKQICGKSFKVLCPGIRPLWSVKNDQKRVATPKFALEEGADYIVVGRAVMDTSDKMEAIQKIYEEIKEII